MSADFLGKGWSFPVDRRPDSSIMLTHHEQNIEDSIWVILATARGERVMRPDFGSGIHDLVFAVNDASSIGHIQEAVRQALVRWEPRIDVLDIGIELKGQGEELLINVQYRVRETNNFFNMVFPFYLTRTAV